MPHRDDLEAAISRAEALERELTARAGKLERQDRELEQLREELARLRKEREALPKRRDAPATDGRRRGERKPEPEPPATRSSWLATHRKWLLIVTGAVVLVVGIPTAAIYHRRYLAAREPAQRLHQASLVRLTVGRVGLLVLNAVELHDEDSSHTYLRLDVVDLASGERLARRVFRRTPRAGAAGPGHVWLQQDAPPRLTLLDAGSLQQAVSFDELQRAIPALAAGLHGSIEIDTWKGRAIVGTSDGKTLIIDGHASEGRPFVARREVVSGPFGRVLVDALRAYLPKAAAALYQGRNARHLEATVEHDQKKQLRRIPGLVRPGRSPITTVATADGGGGTLRFRSDGSQRRVLALDGAEPPAGAPSYLEPRFLVGGGSRRALALPGGDRVVVHQTSLDRRRTRLQISRVSTDGRRRWTVEGSPGRVQAVHLQGDLLVIAVDGRRCYLLAIAWHDGRPRWRHRV